MFCFKCLYVFYPMKNPPTTYATIKPDGYKNINSSSMHIIRTNK